MYSSSVRGRSGVSTTSSSSSGSDATGLGQRSISASCSDTPAESLEGRPYELLERRRGPVESLDRALRLRPLVAEIHERRDRLTEDPLGLRLRCRTRTRGERCGAFPAFDDDALGELLPDAGNRLEARRIPRRD